MTPSKTTTIYIVRHAERENASETTPLSADGRARADELVHVLTDEKIDAVFVTEFPRTLQTGEPVAAAAGVGIEEYQSASGVANTIRTNHPGGRVLVVGHSNTADDIAAAFGVAGLSDLEADSFDRLFVLQTFENGAHLNQLRYGVKTP